MVYLGFELRKEAISETLTLDVIKSSEIEGEMLNLGQARSSIARKLGMEIASSAESDRNGRDDEINPLLSTHSPIASEGVRFLDAFSIASLFCFESVLAYISVVCIEECPNKSRIHTRLTPD